MFHKAAEGQSRRTNWILRIRGSGIVALRQNIVDFALHLFLADLQLFQVTGERLDANDVTAVQVPVRWKLLIEKVAEQLALNNGSVFTEVVLERVFVDVLDRSRVQCSPTLDIRLRRAGRNPWPTE